jgi:hypothetical protein
MTAVHGILRVAIGFLGHPQNTDISDFDVGASETPGTLLYGHQQKEIVAPNDQTQYKWKYTASR